jgi:effector-binding domain-containing protein
MPNPELQPEAVHVLPTLCVRYEMQSGPQSSEIGQAMVNAMAHLASYMDQHDLEHAGPPRTVYTSYGDTVQMTVGFPIVEPDVEPPITDEVSIGELAYGPALRFQHVGPYDKLRETYGAITEWLIENDFMESEEDWARFSPVWEEYVGDPVNTAPEELVTYIYVPATPPEAEED